MIEVKNITKSYGTFKAVNNVSFNVNKGEILGLLGENGAGKTTILRMISSIIKPTSGTIKIDNIDNIDNLKLEIGVVTSKTKIYESLTVEENLKFFSSFYKLSKVETQERIDWIIGILGLKEYYNKKASELSLGNNQKLIIARALIGKPKILILDEIMNGLDVEAQQSIRNILQILKQSNNTIIYTSHNMADIELLCDRIVVIHKGEKTFESNIKDMKFNDIRLNLEHLVRGGSINEI